MDRRIVKTRDAIRGACLEIIKEKHTAKMTVSEIARRADIDRKTFYLHYASPDDVFTEYVEERFLRIVSAMKEDNYFEDPFNVERLIDLLDRFYKEEEELLLAVAESDSFGDIWNKVHDILSDNVIELYAPLVNAETEELKVYFDFFGSGVIDVYRRWVRGEYNYGLRSLIEIVGNATQAGIRSVTLSVADN